MYSAYYFIALAVCLVRWLRPVPHRNRTMLAARRLVLAALLCGASALQLPTQLSRRSALALLPFGVAPLVFGPTLAQARVKEGAADDYLARASGGKP